MNNVKATMIDYLQFFTELEIQNPNGYTRR